MHSFHVPIKIGKYAPTIDGARDCGRLPQVSALVDNTPGFSIFPTSLLKSLGVEPQEEARFDEMDCGISKHKTGTVLLELAGKQRPCQVVFGPEGSYLLRKGTLRAFGLQVAPDGQSLEPAVLHLPTLIPSGSPTEANSDD